MLQSQFYVTVRSYATSFWSISLKCKDGLCQTLLLLRGTFVDEYWIRNVTLFQYGRLNSQTNLAFMQHLLSHQFSSAVEYWGQLLTRHLSVFASTAAAAAAVAAPADVLECRARTPFFGWPFRQAPVPGGQRVRITFQHSLTLSPKHGMSRKHRTNFVLHSWSQFILLSNDSHLPRGEMVTADPVIHFQPSTFPTKLKRKKK